MSKVDFPGARCPAASRQISFLPLAGAQVRQVVAAVATVILAITCSAQDSPQTPTQDSQNNTQPAPTEIIPAGTRIDLVLTTPVFSNTTRRGDDVHMQSTAPITNGDHVVIPGGVFVQGKVDKLSRHGSRSEMLMQSVEVIFPDGFVAKIDGPVNIEGDEGTAWLNPSGKAKAGMFLAPMAGLGVGAAIGAAAHTTQSSTLGNETITSSSPKGIAIGSGVGLAVGGAVALVLLFHSHQFFVDSGAPMQMTLSAPLTLASDQIATSNRVAQANPTPVPIPKPRVQAAGLSTSQDRGTCFTPDIPGTPDAVIPGMPGPDGVMGPPTIIPGSPAIPGSPYPCP